MQTNEVNQPNQPNQSQGYMQGGQPYQYQLGQMSQPKQFQPGQQNQLGQQFQPGQQNQPDQLNQQNQMMQIPSFSAAGFQQMPNQQMEQMTGMMQDMTVKKEKEKKKKTTTPKVQISSTDLQYKFAPHIGSVIGVYDRKNIDAVLTLFKDFVMKAVQNYMTTYGKAFSVNVAGAADETPNVEETTDPVEPTDPAMPAEQTETTAASPFVFSKKLGAVLIYFFGSFGKTCAEIRAKFEAEAPQNVNEWICKTISAKDPCIARYMINVIGFAQSSLFSEHELITYRNNISNLLDINNHAAINNFAFNSIFAFFNIIASNLARYVFIVDRLSTTKRHEISDTVVLEKILELDNGSNINIDEIELIAQFAKDLPASTIIKPQTAKKATTGGAGKGKGKGKAVTAQPATYLPQQYGAPTMYPNIPQFMTTNMPKQLNQVGQIPGLFPQQPESTGESSNTAVSMQIPTVTAATPLNMWPTSQPPVYNYTTFTPAAPKIVPASTAMKIGLPTTFSMLPSQQNK